MKTKTSELTGATLDWMVANPGKVSRYMSVMERINTMAEECRDHWYGPSLKKPRRNASSKNRWAYDYPALAKRRKAQGA